MSERPLVSPVSDCSTGTTESHDTVSSDDSYIAAIGEQIKDKLLQLRMIDG
jgi:hypothetical protein